MSKTYVLCEHPNADALRDENVRIALTVLSDSGWQIGSVQCPTMPALVTLLPMQHAAPKKDGRLAVLSFAVLTSLAASALALTLGWILDRSSGLVTAAACIFVALVIIDKFCKRVAA